jgi:hypothetical protein
MSEPTAVPPAEQATQQASTTALPQQDPIDPSVFVPQATRDNYAQLARDLAASRGVEPTQIMGELADQWEQLHTRQPLDGYDHLAAWARTFDPAVAGGPTGLQVLVARTLESARRDPQQAVVGDQALVEQGVAVQTFRDEQLTAAGDAVSVDPASGLLPNPGPLPVPEGAAPAVDPAVAEQQQAAAAQVEDEPTTPPVDSPPPSSSGGGSKSKSSGSGSESSSS